MILIISSLIVPTQLAHAGIDPCNSIAPEVRYVGNGDPTLWFDPTNWVPTTPDGGEMIFVDDDPGNSRTAFVDQVVSITGTLTIDTDDTVEIGPLGTLVHDPDSCATIINNGVIFINPGGQLQQVSGEFQNNGVICGDIGGVSGTIGGAIQPECLLDNGPVGGEFLGVDSTALLLAGTQMNAAWIIPVIVSAIGFAIVIARKF